SPIALPIPSIIAAIIPEDAAGTNIYRIVSHLVAPKAKEASLYSFGKALIASSAILTIVGKAINDTNIEPVKAVNPVGNEKVFFTNIDNTTIPKNPSTTEGIADKNS